MTDPNLHVPTLLVAASVVIALCGIVLILARGRGPGRRALLLWGAAMLAGSGGIALLAVAPGAPGLVCWDLSRALLLLGASLSWTAARLFAGRPPAPWRALAGPALWSAACLLPAFRASDAAQSTFSCVVGAAYTVATAAELWRGGRDEASRLRGVALAVLLPHGALYAARALAAPIASLRGASSPLRGTVLAALVLEAMLHTVGMAFVLLAMAKERAEQQATAQLRDLALRDGLTGIGNRRKFDEALEAEFHRAMRHGKPLALLLIDADQFKSYNDRYGHQSGDDCLRAIAGAVEGALRRPGDLAARYGGEEIAVLLPGTDETGAVARAEAVRAAVRGLGIEHAGSRAGRVTVSTGAAACVPGRDMQVPEALVRAADRALYAAKLAGRDTVRSGRELARAPPAHDGPRLAPEVEAVLAAGRAAQRGSAT